VSFDHLALRSVRGRLLVAVVLAATLGAPAAIGGGVAALAQPAVCAGSLQLDVANPAPGSQVAASKLVLQGSAFDRDAQQGTGVDRVYATLDNRDTGGLSLGDATLGQPNPRDFSLTADLTNDSGPHTLFVYAHSKVSNQWVETAIPVAIGASNAGGVPVAAALPAVSNASNCVGAGAEAQPAVVLDLANPHPNDTLPQSKVVFNGRAFVPTSKSNDVDQVYATLDGANLGDATPDASGDFSITADLSNRSGRHTVSVYAHSTQSDSWAQVSSPIVIGAP
jgi:hypothetical protein